MSNAGSAFDPDDFEDILTPIANTGSGTNTAGSSDNTVTISMNIQTLFSASGNMMDVPKEKAFNCGFEYEERIPVKGWSEDPYVYRLDFTARLIASQKDPDRIGESYMYEISSLFTCPEFKVDDYLHLRRKHLLSKFVPLSWAEKKPELTIEPFRWLFQPKGAVAKPGVVKPSDMKFREAAKRAFMYHIKKNQQLKDNVETALKRFYDEVDSIVKNELGVASDKQDENGKPYFATLNEVLALPKSFGVYEKEFSSDLFDYLFGEKWHFFNGDTVRIENGELLIPNWWVKTSETKEMASRYIGYGMKTSIIEFSMEPYPWALFRINRIWNELGSVIKASVGWGRRKKGGVVGREIFIAGMKNGKVMYRQLSDKYFQYEEGKLEVVTSLALGELEGQEQGDA